jgi:hypothetical protein
MASTLEDLWKTGKDGCLSPLEQSRAWALREVYREMGVPEKKLYTKLAEKLTKVGSDAPTSRAVLLLFEKKSMEMQIGTQGRLQRVEGGSLCSVVWHAAPSSAAQKP